ncbi:PAS domain S-box protein [Halopiger aswanensis]|uniref:histidine kinase n=1 Tax=Halopiger aswanensis TaxID=148449 RepID=A0A3R7GYU9_9EURY|nr:PAS domain S-box protein [Halopiger aswanensis]RKD98259.1 PAS domain S-box-containing protein [Halopiger aswanensis]
MTDVPAAMTPESTDRPLTVGYVETSPPTTEAVRRALRDRIDRVTVEPLSDGAQAVDSAAAGTIDCLVIGADPARDVTELLERIRTATERLPVFVLTDGRDEPVASAALEAGATGCLPAASVTAAGDRFAIRVEREVERATERRELETNGARFRAFTENASFGVVTAAADGTIQYASDAVETLLGYDPEGVIGEPLTTLIPADYRDDHLAAFARYRETGDRQLEWDWIELPGRHADGHEVPLGISFGEAVVDGDHLFTAVLRDLSDLRALERERETILDRIADAFVSLDEDWTFTYVNDRAVELLGRSREVLLDEGLRTAVPEFAETDAARQLEEAFETQSATTFTDFFPSLGCWFEVRAYPADDGVSLFLTDVTDQMRAEQNLEASVTALESLYDISTRPDASRESKVDDLLALGQEYLDLPYAFLTRIDTDDLTQTVVQSRSSHPQLQPGDSCPLSQAYCRKTIKTDELVTVADAPDEGWIGDPAYETFELGSYIGAKVTTNGEIWGTLCFASSEPRSGGGFSETERTLVKLMAKWVSYETERARSRAALEQQNARLQEFASVVSHDLRNPLNVAQGTLELALDGGGDGGEDGNGNERERESRLEECQRALDRMARLIEDLLALAEQGATVSDPNTVAVADVATKSWAMVETDGAALALEVPGDYRIRADPDRLQQLFENLFRNAIDHGLAGEEDADTTGDASDDFTVTVGTLEDGFYVEDTGEGIPADEREQVFDTGYTTATDGTGFGLSIVNRIAQAHGWDVEVTGGRTGGARFELTDVPHSERSESA